MIEFALACDWNINTKSRGFISIETESDRIKQPIASSRTECFENRFIKWAKTSPR